MVHAIWERSDKLATEKLVATRNKLRSFVDAEITDDDVRDSLVTALFPGSPGTLSGWWQDLHDQVAGTIYTRLVNRIIESAGA